MRADRRLLIPEQSNGATLEGVLVRDQSVAKYLLGRHGSSSLFSPWRKCQRVARGTPIRGRSICPVEPTSLPDTSGNVGKREVPHRETP
jgi:hypothetical protein